MILEFESSHQTKYFGQSKSIPHLTPHMTDREIQLNKYQIKP